MAKDKFHPRPVAQTDWLVFVLTVEGEKTNTYEIHSRTKNVKLATIKWYGPWRQYVFFPGEDTIWNNTCLNDVRNFLINLKKIKALETGKS